MLCKGVVKLGHGFYRYSICGEEIGEFDETFLEFDFYDIVMRKMDTKAKRVKVLDIEGLLKKQHSNSAKKLGLDFIKKLKAFSLILDHTTIEELIDNALEVAM